MDMGDLAALIMAALAVGGALWGGIKLLYRAARQQARAELLEASGKQALADKDAALAAKDSELAEQETELARLRRHISWLEEQCRPGRRR